MGTEISEVSLLEPSLRSKEMFPVFQHEYYEILPDYTLQSMAIFLTARKEDRWG